jgi:hypothetical protein
MNTDGNLYALRQHEKQQELNDMRNEAIEDKTIEVYERIIEGEIIYAGKNNYSMDDFTADFDIDSTYFCMFLNSNDTSMKEHAIKKLNEFCAEIAEEMIDNMEQDNEDY